MTQTERSPTYKIVSAMLKYLRLHGNPKTWSADTREKAITAIVEETGFPEAMIIEVSKALEKSIVGFAEALAGRKKS